MAGHHRPHFRRRHRLRHEVEHGLDARHPQYLHEEPINRKWHHNEITFSMVYAYSEHYVLPISHDEVVYGKGSLYGKMPGDDWQKLAGVRSMFAYQWAHPARSSPSWATSWPSGASGITTPPSIGIA